MRGLSGKISLYTCRKSVICRFEFSFSLGECTETGFGLVLLLYYIKYSGDLVLCLYLVYIYDPSPE